VSVGSEEVDLRVMAAQPVKDKRSNSKHFRITHTFFIPHSITTRDYEIITVN
jgi:hypothetical protein